MISFSRRALALAVVLGWSIVPTSAVQAARLSAVDATPPVPPNAHSEPDHARTRAAIEEVLARPEFADLRRDPDAVLRRIIEWIEAVLDAIASTFGKLPSWALWTIVAWMVLALAALVGHLFYTLWKLLGGSARPSSSIGLRKGHDGELLGIRNLEFEAVYSEAHRLLAAGEWLAATRYLYVAAILSLDRRRFVAFRPSKTNRDYLAELGSDVRLRGMFGRLTDCFEFIVYGGQSATASTSHDMADLVEGLLHGPGRAITN
jgi:hypothetical protein